LKVANMKAMPVVHTGGRRLAAIATPMRNPNLFSPVTARPNAKPDGMAIGKLLKTTIQFAPREVIWQDSSRLSAVVLRFHVTNHPLGP